MFKNNELKKFLESKGYKQKFIAEKTGITESTLSEILNGKRKCSLEVYTKLCMALDIQFGKFIDITSSGKTA